MFRPFSLNIKGNLTEFKQPAVMGIVNITPDSFYSSSRINSCEETGARISRLIEEGADMIDIGACSTRPGALPLDRDEELRRLTPVLKTARELCGESVLISLDTFDSKIAAIAVEEYGVDIINDISGGAFDDGMFETVARLKVPYVLTHCRGDNLASVHNRYEYNDVTADVIFELSLKLRQLHLLGVSDVIIDPGFGFSKSVEQNYELIKNLEVFSVLESPLLIGISRKSMLTKPLGISAGDALEATVALNVISLMRGTSILRVHDVKSAVEACRVFSLSTDQ